MGLDQAEPLLNAKKKGGLVRKNAANQLCYHTAAHLERYHKLHLQNQDIGQDN